MKSNSFSKNLEIAKLAVLSAIVIVMTFVPYVGYINYGALSITLIHIPVIIGACVLGIKGGLVLGTVWGTSCMIKAILMPPSPLEGIIFKNPLVSIIPRIAAGFVAALVYTLLCKKFKRKEILSGISALCGCLTNTILVMGSIYVIYGSKYSEELGIGSVSFGGLTNYILAAFTINAVIEIVAAVAITIPVAKALRKKY